MSHGVVAREMRLPLLVHVETDPPLLGCVSSNISSTGVGLVVAGTVKVQKGMSLALAFALPGGAKVRAQGEVVWTFGRPRRTEGSVETALGVRFTDIASTDRAAFSRFLFDHRFHVAIAFASRDESAAIRELAGATYHLHFADSEAELEEVLQTGEVSTLLVFGRREQAPASAVRRVLARLFEGGERTPLPVDLLPAVVFCADASSEDLMALVNAGWVFRVLPLSADSLQSGDIESLVVALQKACAHRGEITEQARVVDSLAKQASQPVPVKSGGALGPLSHVIGAEGGLKPAIERLRRAASHRVNVLLVGETGAGKEVLASLTHALSPRAHAAFVVQDCGALPTTLLDSALFGHTKGAFTGAVSDAPGLFMLADGGTVFLDEVENTNAELQAKLLRVIETGEVRPVGGAKVHHSDVRIVAATNRDLLQLVKAGTFREDLYYRLNIFPIRVPPLRERPQDIVPLCRHFLSEGLKRLERPAARFSEKALATLQGYAWPGNVRELLHAVEVALIMSDAGETIDVHHLPETIVSDGAGERASDAESLDAAVLAFERTRIQSALSASGGVLRQAALMLKTHPATLRRKALLHGLV